MGFIKNWKSDHKDHEEIVGSLASVMSNALSEMTAMQPQMAAGIAAAEAITPAQIAYGQQARYLQTNGVDGEGTVISSTATGPGFNATMKATDLEVSLTSGPGAPRNLTLHLQELVSAVPTAPGTPIKVKIDPNNPDVATLGFEIPKGPDVQVMQLEQLAAMRQAGLPEERFDAMKAKILGEQ